jgi:hypothetical protein
MDFNEEELKRLRFKLSRESKEAEYRVKIKKLSRDTYVRLRIYVLQKKKDISSVEFTNGELNNALATLENIRDKPLALQIEEIIYIRARFNLEIPDWFFEKSEEKEENDHECKGTEAEWNLYQVPLEDCSYNESYSWSNNNCAVISLFDLGIMSKKYGEKIERDMQSNGLTTDLILSLITASETESKDTKHNEFKLKTIGGLGLFQKVYNYLRYALEEGNSTNLSYAFGYEPYLQGHSVTVFKKDNKLYVVDRQKHNIYGVPIYFETFEDFWKNHTLPITAVVVILILDKTCGLRSSTKFSPRRKRRKSPICKRRKSPIRKRKSPIRKRL